MISRLRQQQQRADGASALDIPVRHRGIAQAIGPTDFLLPPWHSGFNQLSLDPNSFRAWEERGWAYLTAGQPEEAIRSFERRIRLSPFDPLLFATFAGMSVGFIGLGRFDEAVSAAKKAVRQNPLFPFTYRCLASALAHLGREAEAREAVADLLELEPDFRISERVARGDVLGLRLYIDGLRKAGLPE
jgi:adenylate cyclase